VGTGLRELARLVEKDGVVVAGLRREEAKRMRLHGMRGWLCGAAVPGKGGRCAVAVVASRGVGAAAADRAVPVAAVVAAAAALVAFPAW